MADELVSGADLRERPPDRRPTPTGRRALRPATPSRRTTPWTSCSKETGLVFAQVLEHAGVYKRTPEGQAAFLRFIQQV